MQLTSYSTGNYTPGASLLRQTLWYFLGQPFFSSYLLFPSCCKVTILRLFGAKVGNGVRIKPGVKVKFPWRLSIDDNSWIGENVWIDNLACVSIGQDCCLSQGVYLCTGNHDWSNENFTLKEESIIVENQCWLAAKSMVGPGVTCKEGVVVTLGSVVTNTLEAWTVYSGNPAQAVAKRSSQSSSETAQ
jgi:putative colanic acid biosynthesis acetyltransferase WcaF